jgi:hypothetical protein
MAITPYRRVRGFCTLCGPCAVLCGAVRSCAFFPLPSQIGMNTMSNYLCQVGEQRRCSLLTYTLINLPYYLIVTEAQSVVGRRKQEAITRSPWPGDSSDDDDDDINGASLSPPASSLSVFLWLPLLGRLDGDRSCQRVRSAAGRRAAAAAAAAAALRRSSVESLIPRPPVRCNSSPVNSSCRLKSD